jgi:SAM-dependent methyltransferase
MPLPTHETIAKRSTHESGSDVSAETIASIENALWRRYNDTVVHDFVAVHAASFPPGWVLKTDVFEEALGSATIARAIPGLIGMDVSRTVAQTAHRRMHGLPVVRADARRLPFADAAFAAVVSTSTLDHFLDGSDLDTALCELGRVTRPGGKLILTLDNPLSPIVAIRNAIPHPVQRALRLTPYFVGHTCGPGQLRRRVQRAGFEVKEAVAILHYPRVITAAAGSLLRRLGLEPYTTGLPRMLARLEVLGRCPTRWLTGHYIAIVAERASA